MSKIEYLLKSFEKETDNDGDVEWLYYGDMSPNEARAEFDELKAWRDEIEELCILNFLGFTTPKEIIVNLLRIIANESLNPAIGELAYKLAHSQDEEVDELKLRELLWLRHRCPNTSLYGDDGNMQCLECKIDFLHDSVASIGSKLTRLASSTFSAGGNCKTCGSDDWVTDGLELSEQYCRRCGGNRQADRREV